MFSTKAEYGVRVMVELARRSASDGEPVPLAEIAATTACRSPTSSTSWRGCARPGWSTPARIARRLHARRARPRRSRWPRSSRRSRARSHRSSASPRPPTARSCARASPAADHACPTKLLWTRVRFSIVAHAARDDPRGPARSPPRGRMPPLQIRTPYDRSLRPTHGRPRDQRPARPHRGARDPARRRPGHQPRRDPRADGPERLGQVDAREHAARATRRTRSRRARSPSRARTSPRPSRTSGPRPACSWHSSTPSRSRASRSRTSCAWRSTPSATSRSRSRSSATQLQHAIELLDVDRSFTSRHLNDGFSGGEKKRAEILQMAMLDAGRGDPRRDRLGARHRRPAHGRRGRPAPARRAGPGRADHHPLSAHPALRQAGVRAHPDGRADRARGRRGAGRAPRARGL